MPRLARQPSAAAPERLQPYSHPSPTPEAPPGSNLPERESSPVPRNDYDSEDEDWLELMDESIHQSRYFSLSTRIDDDSRLSEPPAERLRCVACRQPIVVETLDIGNEPLLWWLAHCRHPLHLDCLASLDNPTVLAEPRDVQFMFIIPHQLQRESKGGHANCPSIAAPSHALKTPTP
ncbi:hypothetical protein M413DRAFT_14679 [Hebeloma cylindrosporum]|uniref:Uncharacterized protein n=1 Tax=Hebeloma cylindrosporum TaxID=76867 RepID=A0A0C3BV08_HEBCY|nr:hypothetical protein M413DRAFT_14679 [Hebeloma cylindrosporum h7]